MKLRCLLALLLVWGCARADEPDLRQRLAERLAKPEAPAAPPATRARSEGARKPAAAAEPAWGYTGEGAPARWGELHPQWRVCKLGTRQSPIDLREAFRVDLEPIQFAYGSAGFAVTDTGRAVQVDVDAGQSLSVRGRRYGLTHGVFRHPAEERVNGRSYPLSLQLHHRDDKGRLAILALLFELGDTPHPALAQVLAHLPLEQRETQRALAPLDFAQWLPAERAYLTTMGSLTTPPCTEGVLWLVMRQPLRLDARQLDVLARLYPMNARPLQAPAGRVVKESL